MKDGEYILTDKNIHVQAKIITSTNVVRYVCPFCVEKYNKSGKPRKNSKRITHSHGGGSSRENRLINKCCHCSDNGRELHENEKCGNVYIWITDRTEKVKEEI